MGSRLPISHGNHGDSDRATERKRPPANERVAPAYVTPGHLSEPAIEPVEKFSEWTFRFLAGTQQKRRERGESVKALKAEIKHRDRDGNCELLVEQALDATHGGHRHEHRRKNQRDANHRAVTFFHGLVSCVLGRQAMFDVVFNCLDNDDRVVHHEADREDKAKQRKRIDRKTEHAERRRMCR